MSESVPPTEAPLISDCWHAENLPAGTSWTGTYHPLVSTPYSDGRMELLSTTEPFVSYTCAHCAAEEASRVALLRHCGSWSILCCPTDVFPWAHMPVSQCATSHGDVSAPASQCGHCGLLGHNSRTCTSERVYSKVGIEIEGRWLDLNITAQRAAREGLTGNADGSVSRSVSTDARPWEFQTFPGELRHAIKQLVDFYPDETDASCGMHVHVSFKHHTDVSLLMSREFTAYFRARWLTWMETNGIGRYSQMQRRLDGHNEYCVPNSMSELSLNCDRYTQLNFSSWARHGTLECRLLPMFNSAAVGASAVAELLSIYTAYLNNPALPAPLELIHEVPQEAVSLITEYEDVHSDAIVLTAGDELDVVLPPPLTSGFLRLFGSDALSVRAYVLGAA